MDGCKYTVVVPLYLVTLHATSLTVFIAPPIARALLALEHLGCSLYCFETMMTTALYRGNVRVPHYTRPPKLLLLYLLESFQQTPFLSLGHLLYKIHLPSIPSHHPPSLSNQTVHPQCHPSSPHPFSFIPKGASTGPLLCLSARHLQGRPQVRKRRPSRHPNRPPRPTPIKAWTTMRRCNCPMCPTRSSG